MGGVRVVISSRSNIHHLPELTDAQVLERFSRSHAAQAEFFHRFGLAVVPTRGKVPGLLRWVQMAVEAWGRARFAKTEPMDRRGRCQIASGGLPIDFPERSR